MEDNFDIPKEHLGGYRPSEVNEHDVYMSIAMVNSLRSNDPSTRVGACLVKDGDLVAIGYNQAPEGWNIDEFPWENEGDNQFYLKYEYVIHAEMDCAFKKSPEGGTCYVTLFPCANCAKHLQHEGIKRIVYLHRTYKPEEMVVFYMLRNKGIEIIDYASLKTQDLDEIIITPNINEKERVRTKKRVN